MRAMIYRGRSRRVRRRALEGFTLIEVMIAMLCMSILMLAFTAMFTALLGIWGRGLGSVEVDQNLALAAQKMGSELRSSIPPYPVAVKGPTYPPNTASIAPLNFIGIDSVGNGSPLTNGQCDEIKAHVAIRSSYEGTPPATGAGSEISKIFYWIKKDGLSYQIQRDVTGSRITDTVPPLTGAASTGNDPFAYFVRSMNVEYRNSAGVWSNSWDARTMGVLPELIRITMVGKSGTAQRNRVYIIRPGVSGTVASGLRISS